MVMLVWFVLSLFGVCEFTWLPVFIDALIVTIIAVANSDSKESHAPALGACAALGVTVFAFYKHFFSLTVSGWWLLASPFAAFILMLFPGGFTIFNIICRDQGLISLPAWGLIIGIILDLIYFVACVYLVFDLIRSRKENH